MKSRAVSALIGASAMALIVVGAGAAAGLRIPDGSIGWKKLSPQVRKRIVSKAGEEGAQGPVGLTGAQGATGAPGQQADTAPGAVLTYSFDGEAQPVILRRENGATQRSFGPLTFFAYCIPEGEDTIRARLDVTASQSGVIFNGDPLGQGEIKTVQELAVSSGRSDESFVVVKALTEDGSFAMQGVTSFQIGVPDGCHFYGTLFEDS